MILETRLDSTFKETQFCMHSFSKPYRVKSNNKEDSILHYIKKAIIFKSIPVSFNSSNLVVVATGLASF